METLQDDKSIVLNLKLLQRTCMYNFFDPRSTKLYKWNIYLILDVLLYAVSQCVLFYGVSGFFFSSMNSLDYIEYCLVMFITILYHHIFFMVTRTLYMRKGIWDLFLVTKLNFLKSKVCAQNYRVLYKYRERSIRITNFYFILFSIVFVQWTLYPLVINSFTRNRNAGSRMKNIINYPYPIEIHTYNDNYFFIYTFEAFLLINIVYNTLIVDLILISLFYALIGQYKVIDESFQSIGLEEKTQIEHYSDFLSVFIDQQQLNQKLKSFYSIWRINILMNVAVNFVLFVMLTYSLITVCLSTKSFSIFNVVRLFSTDLYGYFHFFIHCFIFEHLETEVNSLNFSMYSCNWTMMDLKFKKLMLLAMRINCANQSDIKFSPKKIVNLQMFASVFTTTYNIVSVMVNTINSKKQL